jgi:heme-degrading monooxygenase HmoA
MICALTVRRLEPGTFDRFRTAFMAHAQPDELPEGWLRLNVLRNAEDPDEVVCFGFFETDVTGMRAKAAHAGYAEQQAAIAPFVQSVGADGLYEIVEDLTP